MKTDILSQTAKNMALNFGTWILENNWQLIKSKEKKGYIDCKKIKVLINGSDNYYNNLIEKHGKDINELYDIFIKDYKKRVINSIK